MTDHERAEFRSMIEDVLEDKIITRLEKISNIVIGNGDVKGCLVWKIEQLETWRLAMEQSLKNLRAVPRNIWYYLSQAIIVIGVILTLIFK